MIKNNRNATDTEFLSSMRYIDDKVDIFSFNRSKRDEMIVKTKDSIYKSNLKEEKEKKEYKDSARRNVIYYSVKPLICKFQKYSLENTLDKRFINIKGFNVTIKECS